MTPTIEPNSPPVLADGADLDTSGAVQPAAGQCLKCGAGALGNCGFHGCETSRAGCPLYRWSDLDPFTQGYVRAALESIDPPYVRMSDNPNDIRMLGFSDLAPATLAAMMKDCADMQRIYKAAKSEADGATAYRLRQTGEWDAPPPFSVVYLKPLTLSLGNDGLIYAGGVGR